jgi:PAS domain-containing protein
MLEQVAAEHAAERSRLEGMLADRDSALAAQTEHHRAAERAAQDGFDEVQTRLRQILDERVADIARLQREIDALRGALAVAAASADGLRPDAERAPHLQAELERTQRERRREFERAPYALCRCTEAGIITDANHSFVTMLGRRRVEDVRSLDFGAAVSDAAGDLGWLLERTRAMRKTETIETKWKTADGRRLIVRLRALATTTGSIDIVVEDITAVRMLEERLRQSQRLEAVGRLASEVAVTCDVLLRDVTRGAREWLAAIGGGAARSRQGERLLTDLGRASSFLRQLGAYGHAQIRALEPVSVQRVLQNLAPVLKRVVGDRIELVLSKSSNAFEVDVDAERIERVLVNVAGYARQRMPGGGQMKIALSTTAVGRRFVARYPHVRPGDHVLVTVSEVPVDAASRYHINGDSDSSESPGVDLGGLVDLVGSCGGHLWMEAQPAGNLMLKIHLPKRASAEASDTNQTDGHRGSRLTRWFRSGSAATGARA